MIIKGSNGNELELTFVREQFPEVQDGTGDSTWATVVFHAATGDESWEESSPCMNLFEFTNLAEWLEAAASGEPDADAIELLGPELRWSLTGQSKQTVTLRVSFHLDGRPEAFAVDAQTEEADSIDLSVPRDVLLGAAAQLRAEIAGVEPGLKDDLMAEEPPGTLGAGEEDAGIIDGVADEPPGGGAGEDNAGRTG